MAILVPPSPRKASSGSACRAAHGPAWAPQAQKRPWRSQHPTKMRAANALSRGSTAVTPLRIADPPTRKRVAIAAYPAASEPTAPAATGTVLAITAPCTLEERFECMVASEHGGPRASGQPTVAQDVTYGLLERVIAAAEAVWMKHGGGELRANCGGLLARDETYGFLLTDLLMGQVGARTLTLTLTLTPTLTLTLTQTQTTAQTNTNHGFRERRYLVRYKLFRPSAVLLCRQFVHGQTSSDGPRTGAGRGRPRGPGKVTGACFM